MCFLQAIGAILHHLLYSSRLVPYFGTDIPRTEA